jgi:hypothetical protein
MLPVLIVLTAARVALRATGFVVLLVATTLAAVFAVFLASGVPDRVGQHLGHFAVALRNGRQMLHRELDVLARGYDHGRTGRRENREVGGAHQALNAVDNKVPCTEVVDFERQVLRAPADGAEIQIILQIDGDGRSNGFGEFEYPAAVTCRRAERRYGAPSS